MATTTVADNVGLMEELKESLLHAGGTEEDWKDLVERPNLPGWSVKWSSVLNEDYADRLAEMCTYYLRPNTLVEVEVRSAEDDRAIGRAILQIKEIKNPRSQWAAKVRFVASDEASFTDWGVLHFDDLQDFEVHFCKKAGCSIKPGAKSYGYFHVGRMRVLPVSKALKLQYGGTEVVSVFSDYLQDQLNSGMTGGTGQRPGDGAKKPEEGGEGVSDAETRARRAFDKAQPAKGLSPRWWVQRRRLGLLPQSQNLQGRLREIVKEGVVMMTLSVLHVMMLEMQARPVNFLDDISAQGRHDPEDFGRREETSLVRGTEDAKGIESALVMMMIRKGKGARRGVVVRLPPTGRGGQ